MEKNIIYNEDSLTGLQKLPDESINCCVTSPPYFGLRDYGYDEQIGLENTPEEYVQNLVQIFREVKRVLKSEGTLWLNLGDSYAGGGGASGHTKNTKNFGRTTNSYGAIQSGGKKYGLKAKDLIGIPWMVAFALRADGWYLRQDIIWHKPNPMPESVTDRCTKSHEYIFLLSKSQKYYYDSDAVKETTSGKPHAPGNKLYNAKISGPNDRGGHSQWETSMDKVWGADGKKNKRSVWTVNTKPYKDAHFAVYPEKLIEPCILAGCPEEVCKKCGKPRERITKKGEFVQTGGSRTKETPGLSDQQKKGTGYHKRIDDGYTDCGCNAGFEGGIVLDPFTGSGTTLLVARKLDRNYIGIELNPEYVKIANDRLYKEVGMFQ